MNTQFSSYLKYAGALLCSALLLFACSKDSDISKKPDPKEPEPTEKGQLILEASATDIDEGDEVTFTVTADGKAIDADIYVNDQKISGNKQVFPNSGNYEIIAKKKDYKDSDKITIEVYAIDIFVSGFQNVTSNNVSATQALVWKNGEVLYELSDGTASAKVAGIALHNDDVYVGGVQSVGYNQEAKYWKNNTSHPLTDGKGSASVADIAVDDAGNVYIIGGEHNNHKYILWRNDEIVEISGQSRYARAIAIEDDHVYIVGNDGGFPHGNPPIQTAALLWENGKEIALSDGSTFQRALAITIDKGDVYILGDENNKNSGVSNIGKYWKNRVPTLLEEAETSVIGLEGGGITVHDGDVYVCGSLDDGTTPRLRPIVWKNGKRLYELTEGTSNSNVSDIAVAGKHVYTVGSITNIKGKNVAVVWKDAKVLYELTDGTRRASAGGIAIKRSK